MNSFEQESMTFREGVDLMVDRTAAYVLALGKIVQNYEDTGLVEINRNT